MGELSRIGSLVIYLRFFDTQQHHKPHVHVKYNSRQAVREDRSCDVRRDAMIVRDGKCYAENPLPVLKITGFETFAPHRMKVVFNDGETRIFDGHALLKGEAFAPLADADAFADCKLDYETLTWLDGELDVAPEFVYENSVTA